jgi:hypothetical protein
MLDDFDDGPFVPARLKVELGSRTGIELFQ